MAVRPKLLRKRRAGVEQAQGVLPFLLRAAAFVGLPLALLSLLASTYCGSPFCMGSSTSRPESAASSSYDAMAKVAAPVASTLSKVQSIVEKDPLVVFSKSYCPFCKRVKKLFSDLGATGSVVELDEEPDGDAIQNALASWTKQRTVPNVFIGGKHVGGCDDTVLLQKQGKLVPMLKEAGALKEGLNVSA